MPDWTREQEREALATITKLKQVLGIPNDPTKTDTFDEHTVHIFAPDEASATLIGELLYRYGNGPREKFYNANPEIFTLRDTVRVEPVDGGYPTASVTSDPQGSASGSTRVYRGGGWPSSGYLCRSAQRNSVAPANKTTSFGFYAIGFRVVLAQNQ